MPYYNTVLYSLRGEMSTAACEPYICQPWRAHTDAPSCRHAPSRTLMIISRDWTHTRARTLPRVGRGVTILCDSAFRVRPITFCFYLLNVWWMMADDWLSLLELLSIVIDFMNVMGLPRFCIRFLLVNIRNESNHLFYLNYPVPFVVLGEKGMCD